jgi:hypothetical protein
VFERVSEEMLLVAAAIFVFATAAAWAGIIATDFGCFAAGVTGASGEHV